MTNNTTPKPRTEKQREAARRNGALSHGPTSAIGKSISARNAFTYGITASKLVLDNEDPAQYLRILADFTTALQPQDSIESAHVEEMAFCKWRQYRTWITETAIYNAEMSRNLDKIKEDFLHHNEPVRTAHALESSLARTPALSLLNRVETRYTRQFHKALSALQAARNSQKSENCKRNPANSNKTLDIVPIPDPAEPREPSEEKGSI